MRISQMRARERYDDILRASLEVGWTRQLETEIRVSSQSRPGAQGWYMHPLFSCYCTRGARGRARIFMRDSFRNTHNRLRAPIQWTLGTMLASRLGIRVAARPAFWVSPHVPESDHLIVLPGNLRLRVFDFSRDVVRVFAKQGFDRVGMKTEIDLRKGARCDAFIPITDAAQDASWFEEPIVPGLSLSRVPLADGFERLKLEALASLERSMADTCRDLDPRDYVDGVVSDLATTLAKLQARFGGPPPVPAGLVDRLTKMAVTMPLCEVARTHGDLQPGNILVSPGGADLTIVDWEHSSVRHRSYDRYVLLLGTRQPGGLAARLEQCISRGEPTLSQGGADRNSRVALLAALVLEDLSFYAKESTYGPYRQVSSALPVYIDELRKVPEFSS